MGGLIREVLMSPGNAQNPFLCIHSGIHTEHLPILKRNKDLFWCAIDLLGDYTEKLALTYHHNIVSSILLIRRMSPDHSSLIFPKLFIQCTALITIIINYPYRKSLLF
ncbi:hypothetical protein CEXT_108531 [Caerostris extrusa]|uniref:Uncharacterized protein n=1 Tax=Caerostris extrusa TaxID=172846 RepID=A0AAV4STQ1_CAEEX|nr:hypothetical protein CEXT_108531 [Caerostris extrusa]